MPEGARGIDPRALIWTGTRFLWRGSAPAVVLALAVGVQ